MNFEKSKSILTNVNKCDINNLIFGYILVFEKIQGKFCRQNQKQIEQMSNENLKNCDKKIENGVESCYNGKEKI